MQFSNRLQVLIKISASLFTIYLFTFLFLTNSFAYWEQYNNNPVLYSSESWENGNLSAPDIIFKDGKFKAWYSDFGGSNVGIDYAESVDGVHWSKHQGHVIVPKAEETGVQEPSVIYDGKYKMWFNASLPGDKYKIGYAESDDGINWSVSDSYVFEGDQASWEKGNATNPEVLLLNGKYYMWYAGGPTWKIGLATSNDGKNWQRYTGNPLHIPDISFSSAPSVIHENGKFYMWYHIGNEHFINSDVYYVQSSDGINWQCVNPDCSVLHYGDFEYDRCGITAPSGLHIASQYYLWYGGSNCSNWQTNLATFKDTNFQPIVIIPGLFASWNQEAILHNKSVSIYDWKIPSFINEYKGIINSLDNLGFKKDQDYFVFPYDWRQHITASSDNLKEFLDNKIWSNNSNVKVRIVGHSLGGLVGRIFTQNYKDKVGKLVTVGSPHLGAPQVYKVVEAGEVEHKNVLMWLAEKVILVLNREEFNSDKDTIHNRFPVAFDLFPTFDFLKNESGDYIQTSSLQVKNNVLNMYENIFDISDITTFIYGNVGDNTPLGYSIKDRTPLDIVLSIYEDGRPFDVFTGAGDNTVLKRSATADLGINSISLPFDHGGIMYEKSALEKIFDSLNISYSNDNIVAGSKTIISPSLVFLLKSPINLEVRHNNDIYSPNDGLLFIPNAESGDYDIKLTANDTGDYTLYIGQITEDKDIWDIKKGHIDDLAFEEIYSKEFDASNPHYFFPTPTFTPTPTLTPTPALTSSPTPIPISTPTLTPTLTLTLTNIPTPTPTKTLVSQPTNTPTPTNVNSNFTQENKEQTSRSLNDLVTPNQKLNYLADNNKVSDASNDDDIKSKEDNRPTVLGLSSNLKDNKIKHKENKDNHSWSKTRVILLFSIFVSALFIIFLFLLLRRKK